MLTRLTIKNFGLISHVEMEFHPRLNILTGETGAGKSIIIDGLRLALGERLRSAQIRDADAPCCVEAVFELNADLLARHVAFSDHVSPQDYLLIIQREAQADGRSRIRINGQSVTVGQLKALGGHLMDFHGPHDHQMLLSDDYHLDMLNRLTDFGRLKENYDKDFKTYTTLTQRLEELASLASSRDRELDLLGHQIRELEQVPLDQASYDELIQQQSRIQNTERLVTAAASLLQLLENDEAGITEHLRQAFPFVHTLRETDAGAAPFETQLTLIQENADQLASELRSYLDNLSFEPGQAEEISRTYDLYENIRRKYGPSLDHAQSFYASARQKHQLLVDLEHNDADLRHERAAVEQTLQKTAEALSRLRRKTARTLEATMERELKDLGIDHVKFETRFEKTPFTKDGIDKAVFYISPNAGEDLKPLAEIVSSGEAARLMLALKKALTNVDPIPVLVFDEIDAQIGGRLGSVTGRKLKELSAGRQVFVITHLSQIAVFGDRHFRVNKGVENGRTVTRVAALSGEDRVQELAQMMGGRKKSGLTLEHAREMLERAVFE